MVGFLAIKDFWLVGCLLMAMLMVGRLMRKFGQLVDCDGLFVGWLVGWCERFRG